jgi:hypothetical protein
MNRQAKKTKCETLQLKSGILHNSAQLYKSLEFFYLSFILFFLVRFFYL